MSLFFLFIKILTIFAFIFINQNQNIMAKQVVRITPREPLIGESSKLLSADYKDDITGHTVKILTNNTVVLDRNLNDGEKVIMLSFQNRIMPFYDIIYNDEIEGDDYVAKLWMRHPLMQCKGNTNLKDAIFVIENLKELLSDERMAIKKKGVVFNLINNTSIEDMRNIGFLVGLNPINMSDEEIFIKLVHFETGKLMINPNPDEFLKNYNAPDFQVQIIIKKALLLKVIEKRHSKYYIKDEIVGSTFEDLIVYCKKHEEMYKNYIRKEVAKRDLIDESTESVSDLGGSDEEKQQEDKKADLLRQAKIAGVNLRGLKSASIETIEKKIAEAKKETVTESIKETGNQPTKNLMSQSEKDKIENAITSSIPADIQK